MNTCKKSIKKNENILFKDKHGNIEPFNSDEILKALRQGHIAYVINTIDINAGDSHSDGSEIRRAAVENNVTMFTSLDTVKVLLDVLEEITLGVSTIDEE